MALASKTVVCLLPPTALVTKINKFYCAKILYSCLNVRHCISAPLGKNYDPFLYLPRPNPRKNVRRRHCATLTSCFRRRPTTRACPFPMGFSLLGDLSFRPAFFSRFPLLRRGRRDGPLAVWRILRLPSVGQSTDPSRDFQRYLRAPSVTSFDTIQMIPPDVNETPVKPSVGRVFETGAPGVSRPCTRGHDGSASYDACRGRRRSCTENPVRFRVFTCRRTPRTCSVTRP